MQEEIRKDQPVVKGSHAFCTVCGAELEMDEESGEYRCPVCDEEQEQ
jgi:predicted RNA-binding Zn-ribbon protein involved in translation (DUF1610 family)